MKGNKYLDSFCVESNYDLVEKFYSVKDLPDDWDKNLDENIFLRKQFLKMIEQMDNSEKTYYVFRDSLGNIDSQFLINKTIDDNLMMFTPFKLNVPIHFIYFPYPLSKPGCNLGLETQDKVSELLQKLTGFKLIINVGEDCYLEEFSKGIICPKCVLKINWNSFEEYLLSLRSSYRRRYKISLEKSKNLNSYILKNNKTEFTERMYQLYLDIYNNSSYKLGKVPIEFFKQDNSVILVLEDGNDVQAFAQLHKNKDELIFEFVGFEKKKVLYYDTYIRLLLEIIKYGIENNFKTIDFGQTTYDAKLKIGCKYEQLYALINHSNPVINILLKLFVPFIQYHPLDENLFHIFKK